MCGLKMFEITELEQKEETRIKLALGNRFLKCFSRYLITIHVFAGNINFKKLLVENVEDNGSSLILIMFSIVSAFKVNEKIIIGQV